jgi:hypothetical protein
MTMNFVTPEWGQVILALTHQVKRLNRRVDEVSGRLDGLTRAVEEVTRGVDRLAVRCGEGAAVTQQSWDDITRGLAVVAQRVDDLRGPAKGPAGGIPPFTGILRGGSVADPEDPNGDAWMNSW